MNKTFKITTLIIASVIVAGVAFIVYQNRQGGKYFGGKSSNNNLPGQNQSNQEVTKPKGPTVYTHPVLGFTITAPEDFTVGNFSDGEEGDVTLVQDAAKKYGMQIYVRPFADDAQLTAARIKREIPDMKMENVMTVPVGEGSEGVAFSTVSDSGQQTREVWFVREKNLYQISANAQYDNITGSIMESWKWE